MIRITPVLLLSLFLVSGVPVLAQEGGVTEQSAQGEEETETGDTETQFTFGYNSYHQDGDLKGARNRLERALEADSDFVRARYWLGKVYYALGYNKKAYETWKPGTYLTGRRRLWFKNALEGSRLVYESPEINRDGSWKFAFRVPPGKGRVRNVNPAALEPDPGGGFYSASYGSGSVLRYGEEGKLLEVWNDFERPMDLTRLEEHGLLVSEYGADRIRLIDRKGKVSTFVDTGLEAPYKCFADTLGIFVFNDGNDEIVRYSRQGDYVGRLWSAPPLFDVGDVARDNTGNFWLLGGDGEEISIVDSSGDRAGEKNIPTELGLKRIWWVKGRLYGGGAEGLMRLAGGDTPVYLREEGEKLGGSDITDFFFRGDRLVLARFEKSDLRIFRSLEIDPDLVFQDRRIQFEDYPVVRMNMLVRDPLASFRFQHLEDRDLGVKIDGRKALPSFLVHSRQYFPSGWIMVVDNAFSNSTAWEELLPLAETLVGEAPSNSRGSIWSASNLPDPIVQSLTENRVRLRNTLNRLHPGSSDKGISEDKLAEMLHMILDVAFRRRGPTGIILVTPRVPRPSSEIERFVNRIHNNSIPLTLINSTTVGLPDTSPFKGKKTVKFMNLRNLSSEETWRHYNRILRSHYTATFRSPIDSLQSRAWRQYEVALHYFNSIFRFKKGYQLP